LVKNWLTLWETAPVLFRITAFREAALMKTPRRFGFRNRRALKSSGESGQRITSLGISRSMTAARGLSQ
jgi:hypothetical protein